METSQKEATKFHYVGLSLASNSSHITSCCVIDRNKKIVHLDKLYFTDDIKLFFENSPFVKNSMTIITLPEDDALLEGKWRIHSKNYKYLGDMFKINRNNWTNRLNDRLCDYFYNLNKEKCTIFRCNINLLRQFYGLGADYLENTSLDCKNFQMGLRIKYGFDILPDNLLPSASLGAVLCALFAYDIENKKVITKEIANFKGLKVLNPVK